MMPSCHGRQCEYRVTYWNNPLPAILQTAVESLGIIRDLAMDATYLANASLLTEEASHWMDDASLNDRCHARTSCTALTVCEGKEASNVHTPHSPSSPKKKERCLDLWRNSPTKFFIRTVQSCALIKNKTRLCGPLIQSTKINNWCLCRQTLQILMLIWYLLFCLQIIPTSAKPESKCGRVMVVSYLSEHQTS